MITLPVTCKQLFFILWFTFIGISLLIIFFYDFKSGITMFGLTIFVGLILAFCSDYIQIRCKCGN